MPGTLRIRNRGFGRAARSKQEGQRKVARFAKMLTEFLGKPRDSIQEDSHRSMQPTRVFHLEGMQEVSPGSRSAPGGADQKTRIARPRPGESRDASGRRICVTTNQGWRCADPWLPSLTTSWSPRLRAAAGLTSASERLGELASALLTDCNGPRSERTGPGQPGTWTSVRSAGTLNRVHQITID